MAIVGYVRVSSLDQNEARQLDGLAVDKTFTDKASGKDVHRPQLQAALEYLRDGDTLVVHSMDRLSRSLDDLRKLVSDLTIRGVKVQFVKEILTFTGEDSPMANMMLSILGAVGQFERELLKERQREGIAIARKENKYKGRKRVLTSLQIKDLRAKVAAGADKKALAKELGVSRQSIYNALASLYGVSA